MSGTIKATGEVVAAFRFTNLLRKVYGGNISCTSSVNQDLSSVELVRLIFQLFLD